MSLTPTTRLSTNPSANIINTVGGGAHVVGTLGSGFCGSTTTTTLKLNTKMLNNELRAITPTAVIANVAAPPVGVATNNVGNTPITNGASAGPGQLIHVIPLQLANVTTAVTSVVGQNAIISGNGKTQIVNDLPVAIITKQNNPTSSTIANNNNDISIDVSNIAQIIGTALPVGNAVGLSSQVNASKVEIGNTMNTTTKTVAGSTIKQGIVASASKIIIQNPLQQATFTPIVTTATLTGSGTPTATLQRLSVPTAATFTILTPSVNSKTPTSQFVINGGGGIKTNQAIKLNATGGLALPTLQAKIVEVKCMERQLNKLPTPKVLNTNQSNQMPEATTNVLLPKSNSMSSMLPSITTVEKIQMKQLTIPAATTASVITPTTILDINEQNNVAQVVGAATVAVAVAPKKQNLPPFLNQITTSLEAIVVNTTTNITNETAKSITTTANISNFNVATSATSTTSYSMPKISKLSSLFDDDDDDDDDDDSFDKTEQALVIDDSTDNEASDDFDDAEESVTSSEVEDEIVNDLITKSSSPLRIRHISNSVVLTKASANDVRNSNSSRNISPEPASVVLMKLPNATQQHAGISTPNVAIPIKEALSMTKDSFKMIKPRSNSIPIIQKSLSPRAIKRSQSLNCGAVVQVTANEPKTTSTPKLHEKQVSKIEKFNEPITVADDIDDEPKVDLSSSDELNKSSGEVTFIELDDSFEEEDEDEDENENEAEEEVFKIENDTKQNWMRKRKQILNEIKLDIQKTARDKNDNIKQKVKTTSTPTTSTSTSKSTETTTISKFNTKQSNKQNENDDQNINLLLCNEKINAVASPSSSSSASPLQENSTKLLTNTKAIKITKSTAQPPNSSSKRTHDSINQKVSDSSTKSSSNANANVNTNSNNNSNTNSNTITTATSNAKAAQHRASRETSIATALSMVSSFDMLNWKEDRVATARGTGMRFELNEFNLLQVHERNCPPRYRIYNSYDRPIYERYVNVQKPDHADPLLYMCRKCKMYGPAEDFLAPEFCSYECLKRNFGKRTSRDNFDARDQIQSKRPRKTAPESLSSASGLSGLNKKVSSNVVVNKTQLPKFRWATYLAAMRTSYAAPIDLFLNPFPTGPNPFTIGMKLEAIDPENCSLFCVCTIVQIQGFRMRLNFDGYDSVYDFWVNADSMDIFPPGWTQKTNRILQPPRSMNPSRFNWNEHLTRNKTIGADKKYFTHLNGSTITNCNPFEVGMFLEADDLNDTGKLCVASVADVLNERIRVHFDGWDDCYDYWVDIHSPYIHPCGWHEGRQQLLVPPEYGNTSFNWREYIRNANRGIAAPTEFFVTRDPIDYRPGMKLEVVDPRNPSIIRPASVTHRTRHRVKILFDCWPQEYIFTLEDDSPDLHPIGWCGATGHELEPPPGYQQFRQVMPCTTPGCRGIGNSNRIQGRTHATRESCPYSPENWRSKFEKTKRVEGKQIIRPFKAKSTTATATTTTPTMSTSFGTSIELGKETTTEKVLRRRSESNVSSSTTTTTTTLTKTSTALAAALIKDETNLLEKALIAAPIKYPTRGRPRNCDRIAAFERLKQKLQEDIKRQHNLEDNVKKIKLETDADTVADEEVAAETVSETKTKTETETVATNAVGIACTEPKTVTQNSAIIKIDSALSNGQLSSAFETERVEVSSVPMTLTPEVTVAKRFLVDYGPRLQQNYDLWCKNVDMNIIGKVQRNPLLWTTAETCSFVDAMLSESNMTNARYDISSKFYKNDIDGAALLMLQQQDLTEILQIKLGPAIKLCSIILQLRILVATKYVNGPTTTQPVENFKVACFDSDADSTK